MLLSVDFILLVTGKMKLPEIFVSKAISAGLIYISVTAKKF